MLNTTIKEVARLAGVSTATVSRVFNNSVRVEQETRRRVKEAALQLRYIPHPVGRSLSTRRTDALGLLLPDLFGEFFSEVIRGCDQTARKDHFHLLVSSSHSSREEIGVALRMMHGRVDGIVIMSPHVDAHSLRANLPPTLPVVLLGPSIEGNAFDAITIDNYGGARQMVDHLLDHGYKRIAIVKGTEGNIDAAERLQGYREAIAEYDGERSHDLEQPGDFSESSGYDAARKLLALSARPRAIFASNDSMAIGVLSALREAGVRVPAEVAVAGFDDTPICRYLSPSLTTVHFGIDDFAALAVKTVLLAVREKNRHRKQQVTLPTTLKIRESCGCKQ